MKVTTNTVSEILSHLRLNFLSDNSLRKYKEEPFRSELFSFDQMYRHGKVLAKSHKLQKGDSFDKLLKRLEDNERTLLEVRNLLVESLRADKTITPASEWLLDNFYLVEEQVVIARRHLPKGYSEALPISLKVCPQVCPGRMILFWKLLHIVMGGLMSTV